MPRVRSLRYVRGSRLSFRPTDDMKNMESAMVQRGLAVERVGTGGGEEVDAAFPPALGWLEMLELLPAGVMRDRDRVLRAAACSSREVEVAEIAAVLPIMRRVRRRLPSWSPRGASLGASLV